MQLQNSFIILVVCFSMMTSFAMKSQKYMQMTSSTGAHVCSTETPSQVLSMLPGEETRCGIECMTSSACPYYQFKSTNPIQCELYNQFPGNFKSIDNCIGLRSPSSKHTLSLEDSMLVKTSCSVRGKISSHQVNCLKHWVEKQYIDWPVVEEEKTFPSILY